MTRGCVRAEMLMAAPHTPPNTLVAVRTRVELVGRLATLTCSAIHKCCPQLSGNLRGVRAVLHRVAVLQATVALASEGNATISEPHNTIAIDGAARSELGGDTVHLGGGTIDLRHIT